MLFATDYLNILVKGPIQAICGQRCTLLPPKAQRRRHAVACCGAGLLNLVYYLLVGVLRILPVGRVERALNKGWQVLLSLVGGLNLAL